MAKVPVSHFFVGEDEPLTIISGPCVIESEEHALRCAEALRDMLAPYPVQLIYKSSYDKANRSSVHAFRGPGLQEGLRILEKVKREIGLPILTDIHSAEEARAAGAVCDVIQIPAFLCRQTDLIVAAAQTGAVINVKKGQFMAPWDMGNVVDKIRSVGNTSIILTDRGSSFGYNNLVSDFRAIPVMKAFGVPVCFDATHSVQLPGGLGSASGGQREFIAPLACAAIAVGADCLFAETHPDPAQAKSDSASVLDLKDFPSLVRKLVRLRQAANS